MSAAMAMAAVLMLSGCAETQLASHLFKKAIWAGSKESGGTYKVGNPYTVAGVRYHPREDFSRCGRLQAPGAAMARARGPQL